MPDEPDSDLLQVASEVAQDFVLWPAKQLELYERVRRLVATSAPFAADVRRRLAREVGLAQLIGNDRSFLAVIERLPAVASSEFPVLLTGETGTGKELVARAIHLVSARASGPFIPVDCTTIPEHLVESELFGHSRGAFTDAYRDQRGLIAMGAGGTLFLDEIDSLSLASQAKLLRLLQEGTYRALGAPRSEAANVRIIAASNQNLEASVREKRFRSDLYFRLNVVTLHMPPLRERRGDILLLAQHFLKSLSSRGESTLKVLLPTAARKLESYDWPGNVRELYNVIQRAFVLSPAPRIHPSDIQLMNIHDTCEQSVPNFREARAAALATFEKEYVSKILSKHGGNITHAAVEAQKERRAFGRLVKKHCMPTTMA
ncbi:MAG: sigma-54-dependent Fis family transcriptional regulator [Acidobacteria bacterium]|nr:sigma-54-dependent Fis family transcriptional regulator [Acidobacteriota bacterium]